MFRGQIIFNCYHICTLRPERANSIVIIIVGITIAPNILNVLFQKMLLPEEKRPGQESAAPTSVPCGLKTLHTGQIRNQLMKYVKASFAFDSCAMDTQCWLFFWVVRGVAWGEEWAGGDRMKIITFLTCDTNSCVFFSLSSSGISLSLSNPIKNLPQLL